VEYLNDILRKYNEENVEWLQSQGGRLWKQ